MNLEGTESRAAACAEFERLTLSDPTRALAEGDALLARLRELDDPASFAFVSRSMVNALPHVGAVREAIRRAAEARRFARTRAPVEAARILIAVMHPRAKLGDLKGAMRAGEQAVREFNALGQPALVARAELNLANVAKALGQPQRAIELIGRVLTHGDEIAVIRGQALNVLGEALVQAGNLSAARARFEEALAVLAAQGHAFACAVVVGNIADTAARAGDIEDALRRFRDARERFAALGAHAEACRNAIEEATLLEYSGFLAEACDHAGDACAMADTHALAAESARARLVIGSALLASDEAVLAEPQLSDAAARFAAIGDRASEAQALAMLARCVRDHDRVRAVEFANAAVDAARHATAPVELAASLAVRASVTAAAPVAQNDAAEATEIADSLGIPSLRAESHAAAATVARHARRTAAAIAHARIALAEVEAAHRSLALARTRRAFLSRRGDIAAELAAALLEDGSAEALGEAFDVLDRSRSLAILDALERPARGGDARASGTLHERVRGLLEELGTAAPRAMVAEGAARAERDTRRAELDHALERRIIEPSPKVGRARALAAPCVVAIESGDAVALLARMPDGATRVRRIAIDRATLAGLESDFAFQVSRRLRGVATERAREAGARAAHALGRALQPEIEATLDGWRGTVVALGSTLFVRTPPALLSTELNDICFAPTLEVAALLDRPAAGALAASAAVVSVHDERAPAIAREGAAVERLLAARMTTTRLDGNDASRAALVAALAGCSLAHVACHGVFPPNAPNLAGLRLADGWFTARDAHALDRAPAEIVLSGCVTAVSARHDGEEWMGLVRGFAAAGARRMVASLWAVDDESTARMMERLHAPGAGPCASLGPLARELRDEGAHPAVWGAFCAIGGATTFSRHERESGSCMDQRS